MYWSPHTSMVEQCFCWIVIPQSICSHVSPLLLSYLTLEMFKEEKRFFIKLLVYGNIILSLVALRCFPWVIVDWLRSLFSGKIQWKLEYYIAVWRAENSLSWSIFHLSFYNPMAWRLNFIKGVNWRPFSNGHRLVMEKLYNQ